MPPCRLTFCMQADDVSSERDGHRLQRERERERAKVLPKQTVVAGLRPLCSPFDAQSDHVPRSANRFVQYGFLVTIVVGVASHKNANIPQTCQQSNGSDQREVGLLFL